MTGRKLCCFSENVRFRKIALQVKRLTAEGRDHFRDVVNSDWRLKAKASTKDSNLKEQRLL